jgi:hypothetical protein
VPRVITGRGSSDNHSPTGGLGSEGSVP